MSLAAHFVGIKIRGHRCGIRIKMRPSKERRIEKPVMSISYSHSFTLVCRGVIPVNFSWVVDCDRHIAESRRVTLHRRLRQILGQIRKLFRNHKPAVSFLSRGQKRAGFEAQLTQIRASKRSICRIGARNVRLIVASGFVSLHFRRSEIVRFGLDRRNRCRRLHFRP